MKKRFGFDTKEYHQRDHDLLEGLQEESDGESREDAFHQIQQYVTSSYFLGINPLRELRRILPQYQWEFHKFRNVSATRNIVSQADFTWRAYDSGYEHCRGDLWADPVEIVTAVKGERPVSERLRLVWSGEKKSSEPTTGSIQFAEICGGVPIYYKISDT